MESKKKSILVVDDVIENIEVLGGILRPDYEVKLALNGPKALEIAEAEDRPDLILLDIMMPGIDGYQVCQELKRNVKTQKIPVIFVTAKNEDIDEAYGLEVGAVDYLTKPVSPIIVKARVKTHLSLVAALKNLERQNEILQENLNLREEVDRIIRHDLKSPLTVFFGVPEIVKEGNNLTPEQIRFLNLLDRSAGKMLDLINRSLDLAKMERGKYKMHAVPVDVIKIIRHIFEQMESYASYKKIKLLISIRKVEVQENASFIIPGDELLIFSMLSNLIKNALEASPENHEVRVEMSEGKSCTIEVMNHGEIPAQIQDRFFEKYTTFGKTDGTGLGAYSARLMARTLGGDLRFQTSKEKGTIVIFEISKTKTVG